MEKKEMMFYKMCMVGDGDFINTKPFTLIYNLLSCNNRIDIVFRSSYDYILDYILVFKEMEVVKQIKKRQASI